MKFTRIYYVVLIIITIIIGLLSRAVPYIPTYVGDAMYAVMMFLIVRFIGISVKLYWVAVISLSVCYLIEFSQLYHAPWISMVRKTLIGRLILGQGFLFSDLLAYFAGVLVIWLVTERVVIFNKKF